MAVSISNEELDIFNKNGFTDDDVQATVNKYRSEGLDDSAIRTKVQERLDSWGYSQPTSDTTAYKPVTQSTTNVTKPVTPVTPAQPVILTGKVEYNNPNESKSGWRNAARKAGRFATRALTPEKFENWAIGSKEDEAFLKQYNNSNVPSYEQITADLKAGKIDQAKAVDLINKRGKLDTLSADAEYRNVRNTNIGKGAVELGTAAIGGGVGTAAAKVGVQALKQGGKQVAKQVLKNAGKVGAVGAGYGAAQGIVDENINPATEALKQAGIWAGTDLATLGAGKVVKNGANTKAGKAVGKAIGDAKDKINEKAFDIITSTEAGTKALQALDNAKTKIGEELVKPRTFKQARAQKVAQKQVDAISPEPKTEVINESMIEEPTSPVKVEVGTNTPETNLTSVNEAPTGSNVGPAQKQRGGVKTLQKWFGKDSTKDLTNTTYTTRPREVLKQEADALTDEARLNSINKVDGVTDTDLYVKAENIKNGFDNGQVPIKEMDNWLEVGTKKGQELQGMNAIGDTPVSAALALHKGFKEAAPKANALKEQADKLVEAFYNKDRKAINEILKKAKIKGKASKNFIDDLDILSENNMLNREEVEKVINSRFGIGEVTTEDFKNLTAMYDNLHSLDKDAYEYQLQKSLIGKYIADRLPVSWQQKAKTLRNILWLLNPKTAERNILGNLSFNAVEKLVTDPTATLVDKVLSIQTGERSRVLPQLKEYIVGGIQGAKRAHNEVNLGVNSRLESGLQSFRDMGNRTFKNYSKQDIAQAKQKANNVLEGLAIEAKMKAENFAHGLEKALAYELQVPDRTFFEATYEESLRNQILAAGNKVTDEMIEQFRKVATEEALESVFQNNSRLAMAMNDAKKFMNVKKELGLGDLSIPYIQTPANIAQQRINYSPVGLVHNLRKWKNRDITQRQASKAIARGLVGTAGYGAVGTGLVAGGIKINEKAKEYGKKYKTKRAMGKIDQSLETSDGSTNIGYGNLGNITDIIDMYASYKNSYDKIKNYNYKKDIDKFKNTKEFKEKIDALSPIAKNTAEAILEPVKTSIDPVLDMLEDAFGYRDILEHKSILGVLDHATGQGIRGLTSSTLRDFAKGLDEYERTTKTTSDIGTALNDFRASIPVLRNTLPIKYDAAGQPIRTRGFANELLNPVKVTKVSKDKVLNAIDTLGEKNNAFYLPAVNNKVTFTNGNGEKVTKELNSKQFSDYQRRLGQLTLTIRHNLLSGRDVSNMSDEAIKDLAKQIQDKDDIAKQIIATEMFGAKQSDPVQVSKGKLRFKYKKAGNIDYIDGINRRIKYQEKMQERKSKYKNK